MAQQISSATDNVALSARFLENVAKSTEIYPDDKFSIVPKVIAGTVLKITAAAFAVLELMARGAFLIIVGIPISYFSPKTVTNMTEMTKSALVTITDAAAALGTIHAKVGPAPMDYEKSPVHTFAYEYRKFLHEYRKPILAAGAVALCYKYGPTLIGRIFAISMLTYHGFPNGETLSDNYGKVLKFLIGYYP